MLHDVSGEGLLSLNDLSMLFRPRDVDQIEDMGNLNLVGSELAVSVFLSSLARRNICLNFVVTCGVFKCDHDPPSSLWGCRDDAAPRGNSFDGKSQSGTSREAESYLCGK